MDRCVELKVNLLQHGFPTLSFARVDLRKGQSLVFEMKPRQTMIAIMQRTTRSVVHFVPTRHS